MYRSDLAAPPGNVGKMEMKSEGLPDTLTIAALLAVSGRGPDKTPCACRIP